MQNSKFARVHSIRVPPQVRRHPGRFAVSTISDKEVKVEMFDTNVNLVHGNVSPKWVKVEALVEWCKNGTHATRCVYIAQV